MEKNEYHSILADFGLARGKECLLDTKNEKVFTLWYRPLEALLQIGKYTSKADVWALGCTLYELYYGQPLFSGENTNEMIEQITQLTGGITNKKSFYYKDFKTISKDFVKTDEKYIFIEDNKDLNDLLSRMLEPDPDLRTDIFSLQNHKYFKNVLSSCYIPYKTKTNKCIDRVKLFDRHIDFLTHNKNYTDFFNRAIIWLMKVYVYYTSNLSINSFEKLIFNIYI